MTLPCIEQLSFPHSLPSLECLMCPPSLDSSLIIAGIILDKMLFSIIQELMYSLNGQKLYRIPLHIIWYRVKPLPTGPCALLGPFRSCWILDLSPTSHLFVHKHPPSHSVIETTIFDGLRKVLTYLVIPVSGHGFHTFRRSTLAYDNDIELKHIMAHGLWRSSAV